MQQLCSNYIVNFTGKILVSSGTYNIGSREIVLEPAYDNIGSSEYNLGPFSERFTAVLWINVSHPNNQIDSYQFNICKLILIPGLIIISHLFI